MKTSASFRRSRLPLVAFVVATALTVAAPGSAQVVEYYHLDALGTVRAVTSQTQQVLEQHAYMPFGEELCNGVPCPSVTPGQPRRFTGKERDTETGLDYFGARYYEAPIARFTTVDPSMTPTENIFDPQRWDRYAYGRNNPLKHVDPDGRDWLYRTVMSTFFGSDYVAQNGDRSSFSLFFQGAGADVARIGPGFAAEQAKTVATIAAGELVGAALYGPELSAVARNGLGLMRGVGATGAPIVEGAGAAAAAAREGIYQFPDQEAGGVPYVGQSGNMTQRLGKHASGGRLTPGTETTTEVLGGKTAREIAEHNRIQEITGGVPARQSSAVSNKVDPIGPSRRHLLENKE